MIKIVILCAVAIQLASSFEFNHNCATGPTYWCQNVKTANECNAFKHCTQEIWSKHERYLHKTESVSSLNPSKCLNCLNCVAGDLRRCPTIRDYKDEITELFSYKLPSETICHLIEECEQEEKSEDIHVENDDNKGLNPIDLLNLEADNDPRFDCGLHPRNWCTSISTAKRCNAFDNCLANWSKSNAKYQVKPIENENDFKSKDVMDQKTCGFCIFVFTKLQSVMQQNSTETNIRSYLESACSILPSKSETDSCLSTIERYWPEIYNIVRNNVDPGIICRVLDACHDKHLELEKSSSQKENKKEWTPIQLSKIKVKIVNGEQAVIKTPYQAIDEHKPLASTLSATNGVGCELCILTMTVAKYLIINKVDNTKILSFIQSELCHRLGSLNDTCVDYFVKEGPELFRLLEQEIISPAFACHKTGLCMNNQVNNQENPFFDLQARTPSNCTVCKLVVLEVRAKLANKQSEAEIIDFINKNLCEKVGSNKELCKSLINVYGDMIFKLILQDLNPDQICHMLGLCPKQNEKLVEEVKEVKADPTCVLCEFVISLLTKRLNQNSTKDEILKDLNYVCNVAMPQKLRPQCVAFVDKYGAAIADIIVQEITPDNVCELIGLCFVSTKTNENQHPIEPVLESENYLATQTCTMCEFLANMLSKIIDKSMTQAAIVSDLEHICNSTMPASWRNKCDSFVGTYGLQIINYLLNEMSPDLICQMVGACNKNIEIFEIKKAKSTKQAFEFDEQITKEVASKNLNLKSNSTCVMCEFVVTLLSKLVNENTTEPEMVKELEFLCNYTMPTTWRGECNEFVDTYGPKIIEYLVQDINPEAVCALIDLCPEKVYQRIYTKNRLIGENEKNFIKSLTKHSAEKTNHKMPCVVCQFVVQFLSNQIQIDRTEAVLEIAIKNICQLTPNSYKSYCNSMIDSHGSKLVNLIDMYANSQDVCHEISLCELNKKEIEDEQTDLVDIQPAQPRYLHKEKYNELFSVQTSDLKNETLECQLCVYVAQLANHFLKQNKTEDQIVAELKLVCNFFPNDLKDQCNSFIVEYGPYVIQLIADDIDPNSACQAMSLCEKQNDEKKKFASYLIQYRLRP